MAFRYFNDSLEEVPLEAATRMRVEAYAIDEFADILLKAGAQKFQISPKAEDYPTYFPPRYVCTLVRKSNVLVSLYGKAPKKTSLKASDAPSDADPGDEAAKETG